jgi:LPXTG-site transpeptidase (sortase) family protein
VTIDGPTSVAPNTTASITVEGTAGVTGFPELQHFLTLCPDILRLDSVDTEYDVPPNEATAELWADGCLWDTQRNSGCTTTGDRYGSNFFYSVNVTVLAAGTCNVRSMVYARRDRLLYNSDYGTDLLSITAGGTGARSDDRDSTAHDSAVPTATLRGVTPTARSPSAASRHTPTGPPDTDARWPDCGAGSGVTPSPTTQPGELPATGYRARPGTLFFADLNSPDLNSNQVTFTWLVIATLAVGVVLAIWSLLVFTGVFSKESDFAYSIWKGLTILFVLAALSLIGMMGYNLVASQSNTPVAEPQQRRSIEVYRPPEIPATHLVIPTLDIDTELTEAPALGDTWDVSVFFNEIAHLEGTAYVGTTGNAVLAGHVNTVRGVGPFWNLKSLQPGHMIIARGPGIEYRYQVEWVEVVNPDDVTVLEPSDEPVLTLVSCANWSSASWSYEDRLVVRARFFDRLRTSASTGE